MSTPETPMTATELYLMRTGHGLSLKDLAQYLNVTERTIRRWETGEFPITAEVADQVRGLDRAINRIADQVRSDFTTALELGLWSVDMPLSADELPKWAGCEVSVSLWTAGAIRAHERYGVRLTSHRDLPSGLQGAGSDE